MPYKVIKSRMENLQPENFAVISQTFWTLVDEAKVRELGSRFDEFISNGFIIFLYSLSISDK